MSLFHQISLKIPEHHHIIKKQLEIVKKLYIENGGTFVERDEDATALLTNSTKESNPNKSSKYLPIVNTEWISDSIEQGRLLPLPQKTKRALMDEETTGPSEGLTTPKASKKRKIEQACNSPSPRVDVITSSTKKKIVGELEKLLDRYKALGDQFRIKSYRSAINSIKNFEGEIKSVNDVKGLPGIGSKTEEKIKEILEFGSLEKNMHEPEGIKELLLLQQIYGVGVETAKKWYRMGIRTIDDVKKRANELKLSQAQLKGIKYLDDFMVRIPRDEVEKINSLISSVVEKIDTLMKSMLLGSYRRGASFSSDIDILLYPCQKDHVPDDDFLEKVIERAKRDNILIDDLFKSEKTYNGVCKLGESGLARRIDFLLCTRFEERGAFQLHFTGNELYNRKLRQLANEKGYHLCQHGLFQKIPGLPGERGRWIAGETEEEILQILNVAYLDSKDRNL